MLPDLDVCKKAVIIYGLGGGRGGQRRGNGWVSKIFDEEKSNITIFETMIFLETSVAQYIR